MGLYFKVGHMRELMVTMYEMMFRSDSILSTDNSLRIGSMLAICTLLSIACMRYLPFLSVIVNTSFLSISIYGMLMSISFFAVRIFSSDF